MRPPNPLQRRAKGERMRRFLSSRTTVARSKLLSAMAIAVASGASTGAAIDLLEPLVGRARADVPVENIKFDNADLQQDALRAAAAVNDCDPISAREEIAELKSKQKLPVGLSYADQLRLPDLVKLLERELAARCGPQLLEASIGKVKRSYGFFFPQVRDFAKQQLEAVKAGADVDAAIKTLRDQQANIDGQAQGRTPEQGRGRLEADARSLGQAATWLEQNRSEILKERTTVRPGTPAQGAEPGSSGPGGSRVDPRPPEPRAPQAPREVGQSTLPDNLRNSGFAAQSYRIGGGFIGGNITVPSFGAGTKFDVTLGREVAILFTPRNLTFAGGMAEFEAPLSSLFETPRGSIFSEMAFYAQIKGYSMWGHDGTTVPVGAQNVAYTYLFPNPATGTTGVLAGASGQNIDIKVNGEALQLAIGLKWPGPKLSQTPQITTAFGIGAGYEYWDMGHEITQQSLAFPTVSSKTKLRIDEHFFAPYLSAGARVDDGVFFGSFTGFVAPGLVVTAASANQTNLCGPCGSAGDRNFTLSRDFNDTRFSLKTGFNLALGARITPSVTLQAGMKFVHTTETGFLRPPTTPSEQPVRLDYGSRNLLGGNVMLIFRY